MKILVTGARGMLARALIRELAPRPEAVDGAPAPPAHECVALDRAALDVCDADAILRRFADERPHAVVQCAAYTAVNAAEGDEASALAVNAAATANVARACVEAGARLVYPSTDYVFDGSSRTPYPPDHPTVPINAYGRSKLAGERAARSADALVVRTSWLYGPGGSNFVSTILERGRAGQPLRVVDDQQGAPTSTTDFARMIVLLLERGAAAGTYHATNAGQTTWFGLATAALELAGVDAQIEAVTSDAFKTVARRPACSVLDCSGTYAITGAARGWREAVRAGVAEGL